MHKRRLDFETISRGCAENRRDSACLLIWNRQWNSEHGCIHLQDPCTKLTVNAFVLPHLRDRLQCLELNTMSAVMLGLYKDHVGPAT